jgi:hypothetical protein
VSGVDILCLPNASVDVGGNSISTVPVTGNGFVALTGELLRLMDTCPVVPIPTGNLLTSVTDEPALITITSAGCGRGL